MVQKIAVAKMRGAFVVAQKITGGDNPPPRQKPDKNMLVFLLPAANFEA